MAEIRRPGGSTEPGRLVRRDDDADGTPAMAPGSGARRAGAARGTLLVSLVLAAGDVAVLAVAVALATALRSAMTRWFPVGIGPEMFLGVFSAMILLPAGYWMAGLYPGHGRTAVERLRARTLVSGFGFGGMLLVDYVTQGGQWSRGILLSATMLVLVAMPIWDAMARRWLMGTRWWGIPVAVWGPADRRALVVGSLRANRDLGWTPALEGDWPKPGVAEPAIALAILVVPGHLPQMPALADELPYSRVVLVPDMELNQSLWVSVRDLGSHLGLEMQRNLLRPANRAAKRLLDIVAAALALLPAAPLIALSVLAIKLASPGPAFFTQEREGLDRRPFRILKLRTMGPDAEAGIARLTEASEAARAEWARHMKLAADPRIIPGVGHLLRRFSIDELPQLWNVLRGEMSLVGPRPLPGYHLEAFAPEARRLRCRVRPGITGLWQVSGRSNTSHAEQQRLDTYYVRNWSFWLDLHILSRTMLEVLRGTGAS